MSDGQYVDRQVEDQIAEAEGIAHMDEEVAKHVMGWRLDTSWGIYVDDDLVVEDYDFEPPPEIWRANEDWSPMTDISAAWQVLAQTRRWLFSRRRAFFKAMQREVSAAELTPPASPPNVLMDWPSVLYYLTPEIISMAALEVAKEKGGGTRL